MMLGRIGSSVLVFAAVLLVLQEEFLIEKIPFVRFCFVFGLIPFLDVLLWLQDPIENSNVKVI